ncbi:hypothetical protein ABVK25_008282 [Lepraria finkii]|uniref:Uncharacterized protein n=1 Tax=Lepraria finkii TaxID=1340010 RepID=A0ABR4B111_9LECA
MYTQPSQIMAAAVTPALLPLKLDHRRTQPTKPAFTSSKSPRRLQPPTNLITLNTIDISTAGDVDCFLNHIPDFRPFWCTQEGFHWRDIVRFEVTEQSLSELNGIDWVGRALCWIILR